MINTTRLLAGQEYFGLPHPPIPEKDTTSHLPPKVTDDTAKSAEHSQSRAQDTMSRKHTVKAILEEEKESGIESTDHLYEHLCTTSSSKMEREKLQERRIIENRKILHHYVSEINNKGGRDWQLIISSVWD